MAVAALPIRIVESSPGSETPSILRFRHALASSPDNGRFRDVPVDWWDSTAAVWRPTAIIRCEPTAYRKRAIAEVQVPDELGTSLLAVSIDELRLSQLLSAGIARFWIARYRRLLLLTLIERAELAVPSLAELRTVYERMLAAESLGRDVWATAFRTGAPHVDAAVAMTALSDDVAIGDDAHTCDSRELAITAVPLLAVDLLRLHGALSEAGVNKSSMCAHPLVATVASLFGSAAASLLS
jgi:hypothetical protein